MDDARLAGFWRLALAFDDIPVLEPAFSPGPGLLSVFLIPATLLLDRRGTRLARHGGYDGQEGNCQSRENQEQRPSGDVEFCHGNATSLHRSIATSGPFVEPLRALRRATLP